MTGLLYLFICLFICYCEIKDVTLTQKIYTHSLKGLLGTPVSY